MIARQHAAGVTRIPRLFHFVFLGFTDFTFIHYLAIRTCHIVHRPERIYLYVNKTPTEETATEWWNLAQAFVTLEKVPLPTTVFGCPVKKYQHMADVIRLEKLIERGGVYLDLDIISLRPFPRDLYRESCVMGTQCPRTRYWGLCNAVILSEPGGEFVSRWFQEYRTFQSGRWDHHSVKIPLMLSRLYGHALRVLDSKAFFPVTWEEDAFMRDRSLDSRLRESYVVHLWESEWEKTVIRDADWRLLHIDSTFRHLVVPILSREERVSTPSRPIYLREEKPCTPIRPLVMKPQPVVKAAKPDKPIKPPARPAMDPQPGRPRVTPLPKAAIPIRIKKVVAAQPRPPPRPPPDLTLIRVPVARPPNPPLLEAPKAIPRFQGPTPFTDYPFLNRLALLYPAHTPYATVSKDTIDNIIAMFPEGTPVVAVEYRGRYILAGTFQIQEGMTVVDPAGWLYLGFLRIGGGVQVSTLKAVRTTSTALEVALPWLHEMRTITIRPPSISIEFSQPHTFHKTHEYSYERIHRGFPDIPLIVWKIDGKTVEFAIPLWKEMSGLLAEMRYPFPLWHLHKTSIPCLLRVSESTHKNTFMPYSDIFPLRRLTSTIFPFPVYLPATLSHTRYSKILKD